jgi:hypothetical protein
LLTDKRLRRGTHTSVAALEKDIRNWISTWNEKPKAVRMDQNRRRDTRPAHRISTADS